MNQTLIERRRALEAARRGDGRRAVDSQAAQAIREDVRASWDRCAAALPVSLAAAPMDDADEDGREVVERWEASPIRRAAPGLADELAQVAEDGDLVGAVTDETGRILWSGGGRFMARRAEQVHFTAGGRWDERSAGTTLRRWRC